MVQYGRPSRSSWKESVHSSFRRTVLGKAINCRKSYWNMAGIKFRIWKETKSWSDVGSTHQEVDLGEPTSFLDHVYLGYTQKTMWSKQKNTVDNYRTMFESRISAGGVEKLPFRQNLRISSWSYDMAGHAKKCVERYCELANKTTHQIYEVSTPLSMTPLQRRRNKICWRIVTSMLSNCSEMLVLGTYWTTWYSMVSSEIVSLGIGLRLGGLLALELWDLIVSVLANISHVSDRSGQPDSDDHKRHKSQKKIDVIKDIDSVPLNVQSARQEALLYVFEDNEAVIKMIINGRSPTMRHVSRTHRIALDCLFDRINLDFKIQIKYIDTKN